MILKLLLVMLVIGAVYFMFIKKKPIAPTADKRDTREVNEMVECSKCSVFVSLNEAKLSGASYYCSQECLEKSA